MPQEKSAIARAIGAAGEKFNTGGQVALAGAIGVSQQSVSKWSVRGWAPPDRAEAIARASGGAVSESELIADHERATAASV
jgi:DNA-binding transcriptional regulator YdaS (Cro superfamily)